MAKSKAVRGKWFIKIDSLPASVRYTAHLASSGVCEEMLKKVKRCDGRFILYEAELWIIYFLHFFHGVATYYGIYACLTLEKMKVSVLFAPFVLLVFHSKLSRVGGTSN